MSEIIRRVAMAQKLAIGGHKNYLLGDLPLRNQLCGYHLLLICTSISRFAFLFFSYLCCLADV